MAGSSRAIRRTFMGVILLAIGQFVMDGIDVYGIRSSTLQVVEFLLAAVLVAGILPGSFLSGALSWLGERASTISRARVRLIAIGGPLLIIVVMAYLAYGDWAILRLIEDPAEQAALWFSLVMALVQAPILVLNMADLTRA